jgi:UDP-N-acetylmuramate dehydrogenase
VTGPPPGREVQLSTLTTLRVGGSAFPVVYATNTADLAEWVISLDKAQEPLLILGGGSNVVITDDPLPGTVVRIASRGSNPQSIDDDTLRVTVQAGEPWDEFVAFAVGAGWSGLESLSGIPGLTGATPIQNVGAYGYDVASTIVAVDVLDRRSGRPRSMAKEDCQFVYRSSVFKGTARYVVLAVTFELRRSDLSAPIRYAELARVLGVPLGEQAPVTRVRDAVLELRAAKGMILDEADHDTWSVGSFFTNPLLTDTQWAELLARAQRYEEQPVGYPETAGRVKTSAAWLIEQAGFARGYGQGPAKISSKHTLALTNTGSATADDVVSLAREVRAGVFATWGVLLHPEPVFVGVAL